MKLISLTVTSPMPYDSWTGLRGTLKVGDSEGTQEITLSSAALARIISAISHDVAVRAKLSANKVQECLTEAKDEMLLLESNAQLQLD